MKIYCHTRQEALKFVDTIASLIANSPYKVATIEDILNACTDDPQTYRGFGVKPTEFAQYGWNDPSTHYRISECEMYGINFDSLDGRELFTWCITLPDPIRITLPQKETRKENAMTREDVLNDAKECVCKNREDDYGSPEDSFQTIANLWTAYLDYSISAKDVAVMMALLKIARIKTGTFKADSWVDLAGYAACGGEIASRVEQYKDNPTENPANQNATTLQEAVQKIKDAIGVSLNASTFK